MISPLVLDILQGLHDYTCDHSGMTSRSRAHIAYGVSLMFIAYATEAVKYRYSVSQRVMLRSPLSV